MAKKHRFSRVGRLEGACAVVGALIAGPLAAAGNAATPNLSSFAGQGTGFALRIVVDLSGLPQAAKDAVQTLYAPIAQASGGKLPAQFPFVIDQRFIETLSNLGQGTQATSVLGKGVLNDVLGKVLPVDLNKSASATKAGESDNVSAQSIKLPSDSLPIITLSAGSLSAAVTSLPRVTSAGQLVKVDLSPLQGLLSVLPQQVQDALNGVTTTLNSTIDSLNASGGALNSALSTVGNTLATTPVNSTLGGVLTQAGLGSQIGNPTGMVSTLQNLINIPHVPDMLNTTLGSINGLVNNAVAEKSNGVAFGQATSSLQSIDLLNLVHVGVANIMSKSVAGGVAGSAKNTSSCSLADVKLGAAGLSLDGKTITVNGIPVPVPAVDVSTVKNAVNTVLGVAGINVGLCDPVNQVAKADGSAASQTVSALRIVFAPLAGAGDFGLGITQGTQLIKVIIDPSVETSASAAVAAVAPASNPALPHTGAGALATVLTGAMLAGGALVLRRRLAA
jgi:LPXTG-motif cell wall-anchored protein